jgi:hypothetical protein
MDDEYKVLIVDERSEEEEEVFFLSFFAIIINRVPHKKLKRVGIDHPFY